MDNNTPTPNLTVPPQSQQPVASAPTPNAAPAAPSAIPNPGGGKKTMMILVAVFIVVAVLIALGFYLYMGVSKTNPDLTPPDAQSQTQLNSISQDANSLDLGNVDSDFKDVDSEVNQL